MRASKVKEAWATAYKRIDAAYGDSGPTMDVIRSYAPAMASEIETAEKEAEEASVAWRDGTGPGGVQLKIDRWVAAWLSAVEHVRAAA